MDSLQQLANSAGDEIIVRYVLLSELEDKFADKNPKLHDIGAICDSIQRHGFKDLLEYDAALNDGGGGIVAGNGRLEALVKLSNSGANAPRGVKVTENGDWAIPVQFGVNSRTTAEGLAYLVTNNNLSLSGGSFTALDVSRLYDPEGYVELLELLAAEESLPISVDGDDLDLLVAELQQPDHSVITPPENSEDGGYGDYSGDTEDAPESPVRMVQLFLDTTTHPEFMSIIEQLTPLYGVNNYSDCVMSALREIVALKIG